MNSYDTLAEIISTFRYKPGWQFRLATSYQWVGNVITETTGPCDLPPILLITAYVDDVRDPRQKLTSVHPFICSEADRYHRSRRFWRYWLIKRIRDVEIHEICEFASFDGFRAFEPAHGPGAPLYEIKDKTSRST